MKNCVSIGLASGFLEPLAEDLAQQHYFRMARVLGTGGAARAIVAGLLEHGITVVSNVLSAAELRMLPALIDRMYAVRELHPTQQDEAVQNFNMCGNLANHDPFFEELCLRPYCVEHSLKQSSGGQRDDRFRGNRRDGRILILYVSVFSHKRISIGSCLRVQRQHPERVMIADLTRCEPWSAISK